MYASLKTKTKDATLLTPQKGTGKQLNEERINSPGGEAILRESVFSIPESVSPSKLRSSVEDIPKNVFDAAYEKAIFAQTRLARVKRRSGTTGDPKLAPLQEGVEQTCRQTASTPEPASLERQWLRKSDRTPSVQDVHEKRDARGQQGHAERRVPIAGLSETPLL